MTARIVIVGAGAMGVITAYHFKLAGADVRFFASDERASRIPTTYRLYSYDDGSRSDFAVDGIVSEARSFASEPPDFVILALDGQALSSETGKAMLADLGAALRKTAAVVIVGTVGVGLRELVVTTTLLPDERVLGGLFAMLAHKTKGVRLPIHPPTDPARLAEADFAYRHMRGGGFLVEDREPATVRRFVDLFERNGVAKCFVLPPDKFALASRDIFPVFIAAELAGWPDADGLIANERLWRLATAAVGEIRGQAMDDEALATLAESWRATERAARPLDMAAFNAYHHGSKVKAADLLILESCLRDGERAGREMPALRELLGALERHAVETRPAQ